MYINDSNDNSVYSIYIYTLYFINLLICYLYTLYYIYKYVIPKGTRNLWYKPSPSLEVPGPADEQRLDPELKLGRIFFGPGWSPKGKLGIFFPPKMGKDVPVHCDIFRISSPEIY